MRAAAPSTSHGRVAVEKLKQRRDFLKIARGRSWAAHGVVVQCLETDSSTGETRIGFTVTRRLGNAVKRNRIKRRLKEAVRQLPQDIFHRNTDYVLIGRHGTAQRPFTRLIGDVRYAIDKLNAGESQPMDRRARSRVRARHQTNRGKAPS